ncbi:MAG TPA: signal peptidase I [Polyangiaceae bacterium]|nr:signal peptidase I [Polyangiaceae bacterium]
MAENPKLVRLLFIGAWFFAAPFLLSLIAVKLLRGGPDLVATDVFGMIRAFVRDQEVPAGIVLFTLFEMSLWSFRHDLPFASRLSVAGRHGLPTDVRDDFEAAAQLLEEVERILASRQKAVHRDVPKTAREELDTAIADLRSAMRAEPFEPGLFHETHERLTRRARVLDPWRKSELREYVESIGVAVLVAVLLRAVVVEAFKIPSGSMLPTLQIGDHIFVNKFIYGPMLPFTKSRLFERMPPSRGDVIVFENPDHGPSDEREDYIKRVIALPGDILEADGGHPIINGFRVPSCHVGTYTFSEQAGGPTDTGELYVEYLGERSYLTFYEASHERRHEGPFVVGDGEIWVFGDNRNNSRDSRAWFGGRGGGVPYDNIKGRAMFVWLPVDRFLVNVMGTPLLPNGAPSDMVHGIEKCLASRPPVSETTPPPPPKR